MLDAKYIKILENNMATDALLKLLYDKYKNDNDAMCYIRDKIISDNSAITASFWAFHTKTFTDEMAHIIIAHNMYERAISWVNVFGTQTDEMFQLIYDNYDLYYWYHWLKDISNYEKNYLLKIKIIENNDLDNLILSRGRGRRNLNVDNLTEDPLYQQFFQDDNLTEDHKIGVIL